MLSRSTHSCDVVVAEKRLDAVTCEEHHLFQPFSNGDNGASTSIHQTLRYIQDEEAGTLLKTAAVLSRGSISRRTDLRFQHNHQRADGNADEAHVALLLDSYRHVKEPQLPTLFNNLVYSLRNLQHSQLVRSYHSIADDKTKGFFLDALPILKTNAGVSLMRDVIKSGVLPDKVVDGWFSSLAFYKNPTRSMIATLSTLLEAKYI